MEEGKEKMWGEREKVPVYFGTIQEARAFVRSFWEEVFPMDQYSQIEQIIKLPDENLDQELTYYAQRTEVRRSVLPHEKMKGNFRVLVCGNNQPLIAKADEWLKSKGY